MPENHSTRPGAERAASNPLTNSKTAVKTIRKQSIDYVYLVRSISANGKLFKTKIFRRELTAVDFSIRLKEQLEVSAPHLTVYIEKMRIVPSSLPDYLVQLLAKSGVKTSRREAEISLFGDSDIPEAQ